MRNRRDGLTVSPQDLDLTGQVGQTLIEGRRTVPLSPGKQYR